MSHTRKRTESSAPVPPGPQNPSSPSTPQIVLSRRVLLGFATLLVVPWLLFGWILVEHGRLGTPPAADGYENNPGPSAGSNRRIRGPVGPWGQLEYTRITTEIPNELVFLDGVDLSPVRWFFAGRTKESTLASLQSAGLTPDQLAIAGDAARWTPAADGIWMTPGDELILALSGDTRAKTYALLADAPANAWLQEAYAYRPAYIEERLTGCGLSADSISLFRRLLYPQGNLLMFADLQTALRRLPSDDEKRRFIKTVYRRITFLVELQVPNERVVPDLVRYWGAGGRAKDLKPLLESLGRVPGGCDIDIAHLLPPLVREYIYTYPVPALDRQAPRRDCFWTCMNFFRTEPDNRFLDPAVAVSTLRSNYAMIAAPSEIGDLVVLVRGDTGEVVHTAVHIADDLVFTKNGADYSQPWVFMRRDEMADYYANRGTERGPIKFLFMRRKDS